MEILKISFRSVVKYGMNPLAFVDTNTYIIKN